VLLAAQLLLAGRAVPRRFCWPAAPRCFCWPAAPRCFCWPAAPRCFCWPAAPPPAFDEADVLRLLA
jgi:hypothetical protein